MAGRPPKPTALKLLEGNRGKRAIPKAEPKPRPIRPDCPSWLPELARKRWSELAPELEMSGVLTIVDGDVLSAYCWAYSETLRLVESLEEEGRTLSGGSKARPEVYMLHHALDIMHKCGMELGIGAASRTKITLKEPDADKSPLERVLELSK
jgi:P27 family predicted phage terminase small subunit